MIGPPKGGGALFAEPAAESIFSCFSASPDHTSNAYENARFQLGVTPWKHPGVQLYISNHSLSGHPETTNFLAKSAPSARLGKHIFTIDFSQKKSAPPDFLFLRMGDGGLLA